MAVPVDEITARANRVTFAHALITGITACFLAVGWGIGRFLLSLGWLAGTAYQVLSYCTEAVVFGFEIGAKLPPKPPAEPGA